MKINFKPLAATDDELDNKIVKIDNVFLSPNNPRYTLLKKITDDLMKFITNEGHESISDQKQNEIFKKLLKSEGDFKQFKSLLESIYENGFTNNSEPLLFIELLSDIDKFMIAEGNRRLTILKLIVGSFRLPDFDHFIKNEIIYVDTDSTDEFNVDYKNKSNVKDTYDDCRNLIEEIKNKYSEFNVYFKIIKNSDELWDEIYNKHLTGEKPGLKKWSRSKYFADLLNLFPEGISDENFSDIFKKIKRDKKRVVEDFKQAQFVYSCFYANKRESDFSNLKFNDEDTLGRMALASGTSALEATHAFSTVRRSICQEILNIDEQKFKEEYFEVTFNKNHQILFNSKKLNAKDLLNFIFENWSKNILTTRNILEKNKGIFLNDLNFLLANTDGLDYEKTDEQLAGIEPFSLSKEAYDLVLETNRLRKSEEITRLKKEKNTIYLNESISNELKSKNPMQIFSILIQQFEYLQKKPKFIQGIAATIRALLEQLLCWMYYNYLKQNNSKNDPYNYIDFLKSLTNLDTVEEKDQYKKVWISNLLNEFVSNNDKNVNMRKLSNMLKNIYKNGCPEEIFDDHLRNWIDIILRKWDYFEIENYLMILNKAIHNSHRIIILKNYNNLLEAFNKLQEFLSNVVYWLDDDKLKEINDDILNKIDEQ
ncbi:hypothetical protein DA803_02075 [[Mycoplasma] phocae]|uniref:Uncharacterized protein n=1 Tax=[Mycoplasma] phocae TaxID=142651 RepID=A0A2Z5IQ76_9BACT|nr:hypothetical protein [[Mycoplasma] phocae]AXE60869.1 hypothetical protein DA803_02075 [[Mycoplasma] phocae]